MEDCKRQDRSSVNFLEDGKKVRQEFCYLSGGLQKVGQEFCYLSGGLQKVGKELCYLSGELKEVGQESCYLSRGLKEVWNRVLLTFQRTERGRTRVLLPLQRTERGRTGLECCYLCRGLQYSCLKQFNFVFIYKLRFVTLSMWTKHIQKDSYLEGEEKLNSKPAKQRSGSAILKL